MCHVENTLKVLSFILLHPLWKVHWYTPNEVLEHNTFNSDRVISDHAAEVAK